MLSSQEVLEMTRRFRAEGWACVVFNPEELEDCDLTPRQFEEVLSEFGNKVIESNPTRLEDF